MGRVGGRGMLWWSASQYSGSGSQLLDETVGDAVTSSASGNGCGSVCRGQGLGSGCLPLPPPGACVRRTRVAGGDVGGVAAGAVPALSLSFAALSGLSGVIPEVSSA